MDDRLETFDRATLGFWRTTNMVLWGALAAGVGVVLLQAFQRLLQQVLARLHLNLFGGGLFFDLNQRMDPARWTLWWVLPRYFVRSIGALLIGFVIGGIIGSRVWKRQGLVASVAALATIVYMALFIGYSYGIGEINRFSTGPPERTHSLLASGISGWLYEGVGLLAILTAALWARHVARRHA